MSMLLKRMRLLVLFAAVALLSGCTASGSWLRSVEQPLYMNQPHMALAALDQSTNVNDEAALYLIHRGLLLRMMNDIDGSIEAFESAKPLITFQESTSISDLASSLTLTEGSGGYQPPPFEQIQMHFYQALNRLDKGDLEAARVEAMQIDILLERRWEGTAPFGADAAARFLTGVIFEANGELDNALIAYRKAYNVYKDSSTVGNVPAELQRRLLVLTKANGLNNEFDHFAAEFGEQRKAEALASLAAASTHGEVIMIASTGLAPHRYEERAAHMDPASGTMVTVALPALSPPSNTIAGVGLKQGDRVLASGEIFADLSVLTAATLDDEMPGLVAKTIARNIVKAAGAKQVEEQFGLLGGLMANIAGSAMEAADIRSWSTLPQHIQVVSVRMEPGVYTDFDVEFHGSNGHVATQSLGREVRVSQAGPTVISVHRVSP